MRKGTKSSTNNRKIYNIQNPVVSDKDIKKIGKFFTYDLAMVREKVQYKDILIFEDEWHYFLYEAEMWMRMEVMQKYFKKEPWVDKHRAVKLSDGKYAYNLTL